MVLAQDRHAPDLEARAVQLVDERAERTRPGGVRERVAGGERAPAPVRGRAARGLLQDQPSAGCEQPGQRSRGTVERRRVRELRERTRAKK